MEELENLEGIGMDKEETPKRPRVKTTKSVASSPKPTAPEKDAKIIEMWNSGFNVNQIGSMLAVHTQYINELLKKQ